MTDLGVRRPVDRLDLDIADRNFYRVVLVEASDDRRQWRWVGSCALSAVDIGRIHERQTTVRVPETWARYLRLTIQNLDDRPLRVSGVAVTGVRRGLVFEAVPGQAYVLDYGNAKAPAPRYDVARAARYLSLERLPVATLAAATPLPPPPSTPWFELQPVLLWGAMALAAVALGAVLMRLARQIRPSA